MIFLSAGCVASNNAIPVSLQMFLWAILSISLLVNIRNGFARVVTLPVAALMLIVFASDLINGERFTLTILMEVMLFVSFLFVVGVPLVKFTSAYLDVMIFLSITSLIGYTTCLLFPSLQFYNLMETDARVVANFYIYVHSPLSIRNFGLFWEPGAFQAFLSIAILFEIYNKTPNIYRFLLFLITSATTFSTTGYLTIGLMGLLILFKRDSSLKKMRKTIAAVIPIIVALVVFNMSFLSESSDSVFGKLIEFKDNKDYVSGGSTTTASVRYFSIIKPLEEFAHSPILGCGYENLQNKTNVYTENMNTCTFVNFFAIYGTFFGLIMIVGYTKFCSMLEKRKLLVFFLFFLMFLITVSENLLRCPLFIMIPLYGIAGQKITESDELKKVIEI